jgi:photosystem II stability/assembly factor-like uncharacterized protein
MKPSYFQLAFAIFLTVLITKVNCQTIPWKSIGPNMGYVQCMTMDNAHPDTVYAGTPTGIYKTVDCAENWYKTNLTDVEINAIKISLNNPDLLIASSDSIVYKSEDYGETWNEIWKCEEYTIGAIAFDPSDNLSIWVGINVGDNFSGTDNRPENLYHSSNGGDSWESVHFPKNTWGAKEEMKLQNLLSIHFDQSIESVMYVCGWGDGEGGLFVSNDKGETWTNHAPGGCSSNDVLAVATTPKGYEPHAAFVLVEACSIAERLFKSQDYGKTWTEMDMPETDYIGGNPQVMEFVPNYPKWLYFGGNYNSEASIMAYNIEADSWHYRPGTPLYYPTSLLMHPRVWYMGFKSDGVFRWDGTKDTSWVSRINGMTDVGTYDIITYPDNPDKIMAAIDGSLAETNNGGKTWTLSNKSFGSLALNLQDTSIIYAGAVSSYLPNWTDSYYGYKSINGGESWSSKKLFMRDGYAEYGYTFRTGNILVFPDNPNTILFGVDGGSGAGEGLFRSINGGESWTREFSTGVTPLAMDPLNHNNVYLGTTKPGAVHKSENGGQSWEPIGGVAYIISDLGIDINGQVMAATSDGLFKWDGNNTWSLVQGFPETNTTAIVIDNRPVLPVYYVGTEKKGVYVSEDGGSTWNSFNEGLKKSNITRLRLTDSNPRNLYAGTEDGGVWVSTLQKDVTSVTNLQKPDISVAIFPNPNNGRFSIVTNCETGFNGRLKIIDFSGEVIYKDNNIEINSNQAYELNIGNVIPGNYIINFTNDKLIINRKVIFIE